VGAPLTRWYAGALRTEEGIERRRAYDRRRSARNARRVFGASGYLGVVPGEDQAAHLNATARAFRASQKEEA